MAFKKGKQDLEEGKVVFSKVEKGKVVNEGAYPDISNLLEQPPNATIINVNPNICPSFSNIVPVHGCSAQLCEKGSSWGAGYYGDPLVM